MMTPLRRATRGGDQEKFTCLCPATASNISGTPEGAGRSAKQTVTELVTE